MGLSSGVSGGESFIGTPRTFSAQHTNESSPLTTMTTVLNVTGKGILTSITQSVLYVSNVAFTALAGELQIIIDGVEISYINLATMGKSGSVLTPMFKFNSSLVIKHKTNGTVGVRTSGTYILQ